MNTPTEHRGPLLIVPLEKIAKREDKSPEEGEHKYGGTKAGTEFADEKNKAYPIGDKAHAISAWSYINHPNNASKYSSADLATIKGRIKAALKRFGSKVSDD